jgi:hypothetical protein
MKQVIFIIMTLLLSTSMMNAQDAAPKAPEATKPGAVISFDEEVFDFKDIKEDGGPVSHVFIVKNTGDAPLVITRVLPTCGCTATEFTKEPIAPKGQGTITITYDPQGRPGTFNKTVNVISNGKKGSLTLIIRGNVV